jgi:2-C-methyl-D-erythritol 4-phosphate cytidylyltransferase
MTASCPKQYLPLAGATVLEHALRPFLDHPRIAGVVVALAGDDDRWRNLSCASHSAVRTVTGGAQRMHSVLHALHALAAPGGTAEERDWVLVHDAVRPCLGRGEIDRLINALHADAVGGVFALAMDDTVKREGRDGQPPADEPPAAPGFGQNPPRIAATLAREGLWRAQTPQMFRLGALRRALEVAGAGAAGITDEASAVEALGLAPRLVAGSPFNIKVTRPPDLALAEVILAAGLHERVFT